MLSLSPRNPARSLAADRAAPLLRRLVCAVLWVAAWVGAAGATTARAEAAASGGLHPQDGPHVDLRFELRADAFVADISMNLVFLDELLPPTREQSDRLEMSELRAMESTLLRRMAEVCAVTADGKPIAPTIGGLAMNDPDEALLPLFPISGMRGLRKIKFELSYSLSAEPSTLGVVWQAYPLDLLSTLDPRPPLVIAAELTAQGVRTPWTFAANEPEQVWHALRGGLDARLQAVPKPAAPAKRRFSVLGVTMVVVGLALTIATLRRSGGRGRPGRVLTGLSLLVCGAFAIPFLPIAQVSVAIPGDAAQPLPSADEAKAIFEPLHVNLYRAFDFADESAVYDALARSVDGPLLEDLYLTIHRSLVMQEEGGAVSRVREVRRNEVTVDSIGMVPASTGHGAGDPLTDAREEIPSFLVTCRYQVDGRVTHWGHAHDRTNEYVARYTVVARGAGWRIAEAEVLSQSRIDGGATPAATPPAKLLDL